MPKQKKPAKVSTKSKKEVKLKKDGKPAMTSEAWADIEEGRHSFITGLGPFTSSFE